MNSSTEQTIRLDSRVIRMRDVSCTVPGREILRNITWDVGPGEHWAIVGLNGSGKTTLLRMISGYVFPSSGDMQVLGKDFGSYDWRKLRRRIGFVSSALQENLLPAEAALDIVLSGAFATIGLYDRPKLTDTEKALSLLEQFGCIHAARQPYLQLSQGEKQKVLIARALISSPELLIFDEPCAGLDLFSREHFLRVIETIAGMECPPTLLYVSHHIEEILPLYTRALLLCRGEIHSAGPTRDVFNRRNLSSFFGTPVSLRWKSGRAWVSVI